MNSPNQRLAALLDAAAQRVHADKPTGEHEFPVSDKLWAMLCSRYKIDPNKTYPHTGSGSFGDVFDIGDGTVFKLTNDETEAVASAKVMHVSGIDHIVKIFDVVQLKSMESRELLWAIRQEKLDPPDHKYVTMAAIWRKWRDYSSNERYINQKTVKEFEKGWSQFAQYVADSDLIKKRDVKDFCKWLDDVAQETAKVGVKFWDLHGGNIMRRENSRLIDDHVIIDLGHSKIEGEHPEYDELNDLFEAAATSIAEKPTDSDAYLIEQVLPSISDDQFAAVVGLHGFMLMNDLAVDMENQTVEGLLQHQEKQLNLQMIFRGSYVTEHDGEWVCSIGSIGSMDSSDEEPLVEHQPFEFDPETDAVNLMKAVARLLGELSGDDEDQTENTSPQPDSLSGPASSPAPERAPSPPASTEQPPASPPAPAAPSGGEPPGKSNPLS